ncbi:MAG: 1-deoxy-D-xylulose-5-phosphate synthase [Candidatus Pacebacteria bacterium]|nr:1-deoxy-D-xylulose-5-phosphate synthase [Candidatus Paceibacterota bacterium]
MKPRPLLDTIKRPHDIKAMAHADLPKLAEEIRGELIDVISSTGGHLASNLGVVELTIALMRAFDVPNDKIVWDTGHQGYVYKLLTGRRQLFQSLRQDNGCCGFLHRGESDYDMFGAGHAGTAISAALGFAVARDRSQGNEHVVAVVGDGAMGCGISLEGLNSICEATKDFVLVINDNKMSIAPNVGALSHYLNRLISGEHYNKLKDLAAETVGRIPRFGSRLRNSVRRVEEAAKGILVPGGIFEELGLRYIGPLNGHDLDELTETFHNIRKLRQPLVVHVLTEKGHGYPHAENEPETFHGLSQFNPESGQPLGKQSQDQRGKVSFSETLGTSLATCMENDPRVIAITAGMCKGTGLQTIRHDYPDRFFDVGIAEEHAVVFAAGLAAAGLRPVVAIYATFMHRALDYVFHDVCLQDLPVVFCLDRAGIVADGPTHHGIHDLPLWHHLPNLSVMQPADGEELQHMLELGLQQQSPCIIRYPKGDASALEDISPQPLQWGKADVIRDGTDVALWCLGREAIRGLQIADDLKEAGISSAVVNVRFTKPLDVDLLQKQARDMPIVTLEDHTVPGGLASVVTSALTGISEARLLTKGWPETVVPWGTDTGIRKTFGLGREDLCAAIEAFLQNGRA